MNQSTNILQRNIYDPIFKEKFLLVGSCILTMYTDILKEFTKEWKDYVTYCLEIGHYNKLHSKLAAILGTGNTKKMAFLTVDGSPHCVQMHYLSKYLKRELKSKVNFSHFVISEDGIVYKVDMDDINKSNLLALVGKKY